MKILLISNLYPSLSYPSYGSFVKNFEHSMEAIGCTFVKKILLTKHENKLVKILKYIDFYLRIIYFSIFAKYDLIYIHYINHTLLPFVILKYIINKPIVANAHGSDVFYESNFAKILGKITQNVFKHLSLVVVPSEYFKKIMIQFYSISQNKVFVSPSGGIDIQKFQTKNIKNDSIFKIGFLSRIDKDKGYDTFIESCNYLKKYINFEAVIGGDGKESKKLFELIEKYELKSIINYKGTIPHEKVPYFFNEIDVFVFPSKRKGESLGLVALEALASGTPVIAHRNGAVEDFVIPNKNGYIYENDSSIELSKYIMKFYKLNKKEKEIFIQNARETALKYDNRNIALNLNNRLMQIK